MISIFKGLLLITILVIGFAIFSTIIYANELPKCDDHDALLSIKDIMLGNYPTNSDNTSLKIWKFFKISDITENSNNNAKRECSAAITAQFSLSDLEKIVSEIKYPDNVSIAIMIESAKQSHESESNTIGSSISINYNIFYSKDENDDKMLTNSVNTPDTNINALIKLNTMIFKTK